MATNPRRILYVAYPLLTVSEESAGGAEQMLWVLEREMAARGALTTVAASSGSRVSGELFSTGEACSLADDFERRNREHQEKVLEFVGQRTGEGRPFDLIHDKSGSFWPCACQTSMPVLATLHLPRSFYPEHFFDSVPANVALNCVSESQAREFPDQVQMIGIVPNGIALESFPPNCGERKGLLWLGRICQEKAPHIALDLAAELGAPITLAGRVYPFSYHQQYFAREVEPRLRRMQNATWVESPSAELKRKLLREACALLVTSQAEETSSLVAMEAAASGTPVVAFRRGALPEVVKDGVTGFLVDSREEALSVLQQIAAISPVHCARHARQHFSSARMAEAYAFLYAELLEPRTATLNAGGL